MLTGSEALGWNAAWQVVWAALPEQGLTAARVIAELGPFLKVSTGEEELLARPAGRLRHQAESAAALPVVGDWVALRRKPGEGQATIKHVLPRTSRFSRRVAGNRDEEQVVAANVDTVFLLMGLDADFNPRRLERYLALAFGRGARPVVVLNKADLCVEANARRAEVEAIASAPVLVTRLDDPDGHAPVAAFLEPGKTVALLGSSGVGKSTLLNRLVGSELQRTREVRAHDRRGRHTTTHAQLFRLPQGALVIDTPGMRELQLWEADEGLGTTFEDVEALSAACRFRDCTHGEEPGCAVRAALDSGRLAQERFASFTKLRRELEEMQRRRGKRRR